MNPLLLDLNLPEGAVPDLESTPIDPLETERWQRENRRLRLLRGDRSSEFCPVEVPFVMKDES